MVSSLEEVESIATFNSFFILAISKPLIDFSITLLSTFSLVEFHLTEIEYSNMIIDDLRAALRLIKEYLKPRKPKLNIEKCKNHEIQK